MLRILPLLALLWPAWAAAQPSGLDTLRTRAERTDYRATTRYDEVMAFLDRVAAHPDLHLTTFGTSFEGRALPLVVWGAPGADAEAVRATDKLRVLVFANIHAGEVAGKEAVLMLLREIAQGEHSAWADSLVLLFAPIYNADGNERIDPRNRPYQHGPVDGMGTRANAQGLDLNRDFVKLDAPESRALVQALNDYDPHVVFDLHTTDGTVHGYHLTYAPPLHPNTPAAIDSLLRNAWLPEVTERYKRRYGWDLTYYGNDKPEWGQPPGWATFDPRPRFGTNYAGLRNRAGILSEVYSYATFEERVRATKYFVEEVLGWAREHVPQIREAVRRANAAPVVGTQLALRSAGNWQAEDAPGTILLGEVVEEPNPLTGEPMWRRLDVQRPTEMTVYGRFRGEEPERVPAAYLVPDTLTAVVERLAQHGVQTFRLALGVTVEAETFIVDSVRTAERAFQQRYEQEPFGRYTAERVEVDPARTLVVPVAQPLGRLVFSLLEPRSDSGFAAWGLFDVAPDGAYPIRRVVSSEEAARLRPAE